MKQNIIKAAILVALIFAVAIPNRAMAQSADEWYSCQGAFNENGFTVFSTNYTAVNFLNLEGLYTALRAKPMGNGTEYILMVASKHPVDVSETSVLSVEFEDGSVIALPALRERKYSRDKRHIPKTYTNLRGQVRDDSYDILEIPFKITSEQINLMSERNVSKLTVVGSVSRSARFKKDVYTRNIASYKSTLDKLMSDQEIASSASTNTSATSGYDNLYSEQVPKYIINEDSARKVLYVQNLNDVMLIPASDHHFIVWDNGVAHIYDNDGNETGALKVKSSTEYGYLSFSNGVAVGLDENAVPIVFDVNGKVIKVFSEYTMSARVSGFVDGLAYIINNKMDDPKNKIQYDFMDTNLRRVFTHISVGYGGTDRPQPLRDDRRFYNSLEFDTYSNELGTFFTRLYGIMDSMGTIVKRPMFVANKVYSEGLAAACIKYGQQELWGFVDKQGEWVINPIFNNPPGDFHDGYALALKKNKKYVFINKNGEVVSPEYESAVSFCDGYAFVMDTDGAKVINRDFKTVKILEGLRFYGEIAWPYSSLDVSFVKDGLVYIRDHSNTRVYSITGDYLIDLNHDTYFNDGIASYYIHSYSSPDNKEHKGYINLKGEVILKVVESEF